MIPMSDTTEVFDVELRAIYECLLTCRKYICLHHLRHRRIHIFTDNQATITRAAGLHRGRGQETAYHIHDITWALRSHDASTTIHWVPGHTNIPGNETANTLAKQATTMQPTMAPTMSLSWLGRTVWAQHTEDWETWYATSPRPRTYTAPFPRCLDAAYTGHLCKLSTAILGLRTGYGYLLDCVANTPSDTYPSRACTCPLYPPQTPKHLLLSCPEFHSHRTTLWQDLKLHRNARLNLHTILHTPSGTEALSTLISATKVATAEWAYSRLSKTRAAGETPVSLTTGWGTLLMA
jgi:ribonuclease HI